MYELLTLILAVLLAIICRVLLNGQTFILPKIIKSPEGVVSFQLNSFGNILIAIVSTIFLIQTMPESFITPILAFVTVYGTNAVIESSVTKILPNQQTSYNDEEA